jgi:hypothetical protein
MTKHYLSAPIPPYRFVAIPMRSLEVEQEFAAKEKAKKTTQPRAKAVKKAA